MPDASDMDLLREYAHHNSESAFAKLVQRHINLAYSVAVRFTGPFRGIFSVVRKLAYV